MTMLDPLGNKGETPHWMDEITVPEDTYAFAPEFDSVMQEQVNRIVAFLHSMAKTDSR